MNTAIELTYNINVVGGLACARREEDGGVLVGLEPNINLFPSAIQNGHINLIIRCVIGLADEPPTPSDGIKSGCPPFPLGIKLRRVLVMAHSDVGRRDASLTPSLLRAQIWD